MNALSASSLATFYGLRSDTNFETLFSTEKRRTSDFDVALTELKEAARGGNLNSLDMLMDIARGDDGDAKQIESFLFGLFSDPPYGREYLAQEVAHRAAMAQAFIKPHDQPDGLNPNGVSKLLYMAGSQENNVERRTALSRQFCDSLNLEAEPNIWNTNRYITGEELDADLTRWERDIKDRNSVKNACLPSFGKTVSIADYKPSVRPQWHLTPVLVDEHFVLVCDKSPQDTPRETVVFSSMRLNDLQKALILSQCPDAKISEAPLQEHVPNGCGLFVRAAREHLANDPARYIAWANPLQALTNLIQKWSQMSPQQLSAFNVNGRRQMFGQLLDTTAHAGLASAAPHTEVFNSRDEAPALQRDGERNAKSSGVMSNELREKLRVKLVEEGTLKQWGLLLLSEDAKTRSRAIQKIVKIAIAGGPTSQEAEAMLFKNFANPPNSIPGLREMIAEKVQKSVAGKPQLLAGKLLDMARFESKGAAQR